MADYNIPGSVVVEVVVLQRLQAVVLWQPQAMLVRQPELSVVIRPAIWAPGDDAPPIPSTEAPAML